MALTEREAPLSRRSSPFSEDEFARRRARVAAELERRELDALIVTRPQNVFYLTGFRSLGAGLASAMGSIACAIFVPAAVPIVVVRSLERRLAEQRVVMAEVASYSDGDDPFALITRHLPHRTTRVGMELTDASARQVSRLQRALPGAQIDDASMVIDAVRRVKSAEELSHVRSAAVIAELGLNAAIEEAHEGARVSQVLASAWSAMMSAGQDDLSTPPVMVWAGSAGGLMHDTRTDHLVAHGDLVMIEATGCRELYVANAMGTITVGRPSTALAEAYECAVAMHDAARASVRSGVAAHAVHSAVDAVSRGSGRGPYARRVGGTIGITGQPGLFFEGLDLVAGQDLALQSGMTVLIQPGVDQPASVVVASTSLVADAGPIPLTRHLPSLIVR